VGLRHADQEHSECWRRCASDPTCRRRDVIPPNPILLDLTCHEPSIEGAGSRAHSGRHEKLALRCSQQRCEALDVVCGVTGVRASRGLDQAVDRSDSSSC
jgi:hypothetical protein